MHHLEQLYERQDPNLVIKDLNSWEEEGWRIWRYKNNTLLVFIGFDYKVDLFIQKYNKQIWKITEAIYVKCNILQ